MKCDRCGSTEFEEQNGVYVCKYCGTRYTPEGEEEEEEEREETAQPDQAEESGEEMQAQSINAGLAFASGHFVLPAAECPGFDVHCVVIDRYLHSWNYRSLQLAEEQMVRL